MSVVNYQRFKAYSIFGLIGTGNSVTFITRQSHVRRYVAVTACQLVLIWDTRKQVKVATLQCPDVEGTVQELAVQPPTDNSLNNSNIAAGYSSGEVVVFSIKQNSAIDPIVFAGHRGTVSSLAWDNSGMRLASAGVDGEIVIWDTVSERGIIRLRGHKGVVTRVLFLTTRDGLVSCGKDGSIKFWDVPTGHCYRTLAPLTAEVWDIAVLRSDTRLVVGGNDASLDVWGLTFKNSAAPESETSAQTEQTDDDTSPDNKLFRLDTDGEAAALPLIEGQPLQLPSDDASVLSLENLGRLQRSRGGRVLGLSTSRGGGVLACYGKHNCLDLYSVLSEDQVSERVRRRLKKTRKRLR
ncbi:WD40 repeat [Trinorchestia longiramus]|nr:WD40 repeat [Trinorchestia longiramus]